MSKWEVLKYVRPSGRCPLDDWINSRRLTVKDQAKLDGRIEAIESLANSLPPEWLKNYKTTNLKELKVKGDHKQLRPLCVLLPEKQIVILVGAIEKGGKIDKGDLESGKRIATDLSNGIGNTKGYWED